MNNDDDDDDGNNYSSFFGFLKLQFVWCNSVTIWVDLQMQLYALNYKPRYVKRQPSNSLKIYTSSSLSLSFYSYLEYYSNNRVISFPINFYGIIPSQHPTWHHQLTTNTVTTCVQTHHFLPLSLSPPSVSSVMVLWWAGRASP